MRRVRAAVWPSLASYFPASRGILWQAGHISSHYWSRPWRKAAFIGYSNEEALETSLRERIAVLWSTARNELWRKGATSGDVLELAEIRVNCEQNSVLYLVHPTTGGACHTVSASGSTRPSCYYRAITDETTLQPAAGVEVPVEGV